MKLELLISSMYHGSRVLINRSNGLIWQLRKEALLYNKKNNMNNMKYSTKVRAMWATITLMVACAGFIGLAKGQAVTNDRRNQGSSYDQAPGDYYTGRSPFFKRIFGGGSTPEPAPKPQTAPAVQSQPVRGFGPSYTKFDEGGQTFIKGSMSFPTGMQGHDGLLLEKVVPAEVMVNHPFDYEYRVINLTSYPIHQVMVMDRVTDNFEMADADPDPSNLSDGVATWNLGEMGARETRVIKVRGNASEEGTITTCGWATYSPILCEPIKVVKADLQLVKTGPAKVDICDPIPYTIKVTNTGSSVLTGVKVTDEMESGLTTNGSRTAFADIGTLRPGETRTFNVEAKASKTGEFTNVAKVVTAQGIEAQDEVVTVVTAPSLSIACSTDEERFVGRPIQACFTVTNNGDSASENTVVELTVPAGSSFRGASTGGRLVGDKVVWNLGSLAAEANKEVCANFVGTQVGNLVFTASASGGCGNPVQTSCSTKVSGIPAVLLEVIDIDDPIEVGANETYEIVVTNQGSANDTNIKIVCTLEDTQQFVSAGGATSGSANGQVVEFAPLATLGAGQKAVWRLVVKAVKAGDVRFGVRMTTDETERPVEETESTHQY